MIRLSVCLFMLLVAPGFADTFPAMMTVTGVSTDDHLNVRQDPTTASPVIGQLEAGQMNVEVVAASDDGKWGLVNVYEGSGWVSLRYLAGMPDAQSVPGELYCAGTEPFWAAEFGNASVAFSSPETEKRSIMTSGWSSSANHTGRFSATSDTATAVLARDLCSDGMSDRAYGFTLDLVFHSDQMQTHLTGCCSLAP